MNIVGHPHLTQLLSFVLFISCIFLKRSIESTMELNMFYVLVCEVEASCGEIFILLARPNRSRT